LKSETYKTRITILGSGTCVQSLVRSACSVLVETGASKLVLDMGPGTMRRLLETGNTIFDISHIFLSHFHPDHTAELVPFLFANKYPDGNRRKIPLTVLASRGFKIFFKGLYQSYGEYIALPPDLFQIIELNPETPERYLTDDFSVQWASVAHRPESLAYRIADTSGKSLVYSGDTDMSENLVALAKSTDLLICESALPDSLRVPGHLTPSLAGDMASRARVKKLVLTHFYPQCEGADLVNQCRKTYGGQVVLATDLMQFTLG